MSRRLLAIAVLPLALLVAPSVARADFGFAPGSVQVTALDAAGQPELRAGAHPDKMVARFAFNTIDAGADGNVKDVAIDLPTGFAGDARAVPTCARSAFVQQRCPRGAQVGVMQATFAGFTTISFPIYDLTPEQGEFAELGFFALVVPVRLVIGVRSDGDYGTEISIRDLPQNLPLTAGRVELWGVPADHQRNTATPRKAFLTNPTSCDGPPPTTTLRARSWQQPERWIAEAAPTSGSLVGCEQLAFDPGVGLGLDTPTADSPSGLSVEVALPQDDNPDGLATSEARQVAITLPAGLTLSPGVAEGLAACDDDQLGIGTLRPAACPAASKIGTVELTTPLLVDPLEGGLYLGRALPNDRYRLLLAASGRGVTTKLVGSLLPDPETGQVYLLLKDLPALPFSHLKLHFKSGPRAPLATPPGCGAGAGSAAVTAYRGGPPTQVAVGIEIASGPGGAPCGVAAPFAPLFVAGSSPPFGGSDSSFSMTVRRADGEQALDRVSVRLPAGLSARLAHVARCAAARAARAACPSASRVGSVGVEAGAGSSPLPLTGAIYLTGPYRGAPFGLALVLRAQVGPIDLGTAVIRATLQLDPTDARLTVATDSLPQVLAGVPLRLRALAIDIDRRGFMVNPTSCAQTRIAAAIGSIDEATSHASSRYALGGCRKLPFAPTVSMALTSRAELRRGGHPGLTIALQQRQGQAALRSATVELPRMLRLDAAAVATICTRERASEGRCPRGSAVGSAQVRSPLLPRPLTGSLDVVQPLRGTQPDLWATVAGIGVRLSVRSTTSVPSGGPIASSFVELPDIPLAALRVSLRGGRHGLLSLAGGLCAGARARPIAVLAELRGQNGRRRSTRVHVHAAPSCSR